ncbi:uncharacterized protein [Epargyreus clarus]
MPIVFTPKKTGILVNHSKVVVKVDAFNSFHSSLQSSLPHMPDKSNHQFNNIGLINSGLLKPYMSVPERIVLRAHPMDCDGKRNLIHPYIVFMHEDFLNEKYKDSTVILATMKHIPLVLQENKEEEDIDAVNSQIDGLCVEIVPVDNTVFRSLCREVYNKNIPTVLIPKALNVIINIENGTKIIFDIIGDKIEQPEHVDIVTYSEKTQTEIDVIEKFKKCVVESTHSGKRFLINDSMVKQNLLISNGFLQFKLKPEKLKYTMLNSESFRHCTVAAKCLSDTDLVLPKITMSNYEYDSKNYCRTMKSVQKLVVNVVSHIYFEIHREANFKGVSEIKSNVLVTGMSGTGKSALCHIVQKELTVWSHILHCRSLKGRKDITEVLGKAILMCQEHSPAVLICDDIDALVPPNMEGASPQDIAYYQRLAVVIKHMLQSCAGVCVLMTSLSMKSLHPILSHFSGKPLFTAHFDIKELNQDEREELFKHLLNDKIRDTFLVEDDDVIKLAMDTAGCSVREIVDYLNKKIFKGVKKKKKHPEDSKPRLVEDVTKDVEKAKAFDIWGPVGGMEDVKQELTECIFWPIMYPALFPSQSCGVLLYGPPGTGKSHIGSCLARLANMKLLVVKGPELLSKYIGQSEKAVRDIFDKADMQRPCILFFDEFDSLAPKRGHDSTGVTDRVVNQLLARLDGAEGGARGPVLAATSRPDLLDPALLRPGRLQRHVYCALPDPVRRGWVCTGAAPCWPPRRAPTCSTPRCCAPAACSDTCTARCRTRYVGAGCVQARPRAGRHVAPRPARPRAAAPRPPAATRVLRAAGPGTSGLGVYRRGPVLAATSRPDLLDPALLRPGRLQRHVYCALPDPVRRGWVCTGAAPCWPPRRAPTCSTPRCCAPAACSDTCTARCRTRYVGAGCVQARPRAGRHVAPRPARPRAAAPRPPAATRVLRAAGPGTSGLGVYRRGPVLAATSRPDLLDPALLRPGRLQRHVYCALPDPVRRGWVCTGAAPCWPPRRAPTCSTPRCCAPAACSDTCTARCRTRYVGAGCVQARPRAGRHVAPRPARPRAAAPRPPAATRVLRAAGPGTSGLGVYRRGPVLAATSRPDLLDPALLRPGRLQRHVYCALPDPVRRGWVCTGAAPCWPPRRAPTCSTPRCCAPAACSDTCTARCRTRYVGAGCVQARPRAGRHVAPRPARPRAAAPRPPAATRVLRAAGPGTSGLGVYRRGPVLAATSRPDLLDPALLRPGRLQRHVYCALPDPVRRGWVCTGAAPCWPPRRAPTCSTPRCCAPAACSDTCTARCRTRYVGAGCVQARPRAGRHVAPRPARPRAAAPRPPAATRVLRAAGPGTSGLGVYRRGPVLAATSRPDLLDPALLRPGRLQRHVYCALPDPVRRGWVCTGAAPCWPPRRAPTCSTPRCCAPAACSDTCTARCRTRYVGAGCVQARPRAGRHVAPRPARPRAAAPRPPAATRVLRAAGPGTSGLGVYRRGPVLAATSRPDLLDPALLRPGRLQRHVYCALPDPVRRGWVCTGAAPCWPPRRAPTCSTPRCCAPAACSDTCTARCRTRYVGAGCVQARPRAGRHVAPRPARPRAAAPRPPAATRVLRAAGPGTSGLGVYRRGPVLAATSRPDLLDPALLRPGRLQRHVYCALPDPVRRGWVCTGAAPCWPPRRAPTCSTPRCCAPAACSDTCTARCRTRKAAMKCSRQ